MELKRILAKDAKSANDKAVALYGQDVLVISSAKVRGQTELIVAVEIEAMPVEQALSEQIELTPKRYDHNALPSFSHVLADEIKNAKPIKTAKSRADDAPVSAQTSPVQPVSWAQASRLQQDQEALRGQEIVSLVREELASLRREFKLSQTLAGHQGPLLHEALDPLVQAMDGVNMPVALRRLLIDGLQEAVTLEGGVATLSHMLKSAIDRTPSALPSTGIHVMVGLSGSGKSSMLARWAQEVAAQHGCDSVAVISHQDHRAGAWSQTQLLCSQAGVGCYRSTSTSMLKLLLEDNAQRRLILIDVAGVDLKQRLSEMVAIDERIQCHAVLAADASTTTISKVLGASANWQGLFISKLDESEAPWSLIQVLSENPMPIHAASRGEGLADWQAPFAVSELVNQAIGQMDLYRPVSASQPRSPEALFNPRPLVDGVTLHRI